MSLNHNQGAFFLNDSGTTLDFSTQTVNMGDTNPNGPEALGIDLGTSAGADGPTPNDPGDGDAGGNGLQNFPVLLSAATTGSAVVIRGTLDSSPSDQFTIEFFASPSCDPSGFGEGAVFVGSTLATTDGAGHAAFSLTLPAAVAVGAVVTATATRLFTGDTSEFSACIAATSGMRRRVSRTDPAAERL